MTLSWQLVNGEMEKWEMCVICLCSVCTHNRNYFLTGNGTVQQNIYTSSSYYIAVGNTNLEEVEVNC